MDFMSVLRNQLADDRFGANLIAFYGLAALVVIASLVLRRWLARRGGPRVGVKHYHWVEVIKEEVTRRARALLLWGTLAVVVVTTAIGISYHLSGGDIRQEIHAWLSHWSPGEVLRVGLGAGALVGLALTTRLAIWGVRRMRPTLETHARQWVGKAHPDEGLHHGFILLERYVVTTLRLSALWGALLVVGLADLANSTVGFVLRVLTILVLARLLTLACRTLSRVVHDIGERHLGRGQFRIYWERILRLFPFGERCFEAAVYIAAASLCVQQLNFNAVVGTQIVMCIGIFFGTRVVIELLQVFLNQAFGMYAGEGHILDQKGRTLVPLLQSVCQYVLYFGSGITMLGVLGINTAPILAGAGILGLGVGLGAQSLVTDVVSGFFILFEGQYLVGDVVQIGDAYGTVESVSIRLTEIRDVHGKLHIIPNGQIKGVINYSKDYVNAVVDLRVPTGTDLEGIYRSMSEAGRRLRQSRPEVLADTEVHGLVELGTSEMTVRAVTRVQPGTHGIMQTEYRRLLKQVFDQKSKDGSKPVSLAA